MILPTKHIRADRSLLAIGADILSILHQPKTVSRTWEDFRMVRDKQGNAAPVTYDWFILALDLLFITGVLDFERGQLKQAAR